MIEDTLDISHLFKARKDPEFFSVWYDPSDGHITEIGPHESNDKGNFVVGSGEPYLTLLRGDVSFTEYVVAYDPNLEKNRLMHVSEWTKLLGEKHELQRIEFAEEQDNTRQFFLSFYRQKDYCELVINHDSFANMLKMGNEAQVSASNNQTIDFFVREKNTGYFIARHSFTFDVENDRIMDDPAPWLSDTDINDIEVLGYKNLCTYSWSWTDERINRMIRVNRTRVIPASRQDEHCHIDICVVDGKLNCKSHIKEPKNYSIHENLRIWITKYQHPDALLGYIDIPSAMIENKRTSELDCSHLKDIDFQDVDFLTDNQYIKLHMGERT